MTTSQIIWIVVIAVAVLILIGLVVGSMRKKSHGDNRARAEQLREQADTRAADLPDAAARAERAEAEAEHKRLEAQRAEEQAAAARTDVAQQQAKHEDQIRAADRLDPDVDHKSESYTPEVATPAGPSSVPTDPTYADPGTRSDATREPTDTTPRDGTVGTDNDTLRNRLEGESSDTSDARPGETNGGTHRA